MRRRTLLLTAVLVGVLILSAVGIMRLRAAQAREQAAFTALAAQIILPDTPETEPPAPSAAPEPTPAPTAPENAERFAGLMAENDEFAAWLHIDGTVIDYPVMWSPEEPDFYLHHDFTKQESLSGTLYIGKGCSPDSNNLMVYGHNMKNGTMFADLLRYGDADFCREHPTVEFDTVERSAEYEVLAVFREKVHRQDEAGVFRYYDYAGTLTEAEYDAYVEKIRALSLYDFGCSAAYGDRLLTMSTCAYHTANGRFVVVAVQHEKT